MTNKFIHDISAMSQPGQIILIITIIQLIDIYISSYIGTKNKVVHIIKYLCIASIYIFILNWLCSNDMCWASWTIVIGHIIYAVITIILIISILNFVTAINNKYKCV